MNVAYFAVLTPQEFQETAVAVVSPLPILLRLEYEMHLVHVELVTVRVNWGRLSAFR